MRSPYRSRRVRHSWLIPVLSLAVIVSSGAAHAQKTPSDSKPSSSAATQKGIFVAVGYGGRRMSSSDGVNWTNDIEWAADGGDDDNCLFSIAFAKGKFVAVGGGASKGHVLISRNGKDWTEVYSPRTRVVPVIFGSNRFVVGTGDHIEFSEDGEHWNQGAKLNYNRGLYFRRAAFGNGVSVFCGDCDVADNQPRGGWFATTKDGVNLEAFVTTLPNTRSIAFGAGRFVLVGEHGYRASATDGKTWQETTDKSEDFQWVAWTGKQFVLSGKETYTSPDGIHWAKAAKTIPCEPQCVSPAGFVGASWKTNLFFSPDGWDWKRVSTSGTNAFTAIAYGVPAAKKSAASP